MNDRPPLAEPAVQPEPGRAAEHTDAAGMIEQHIAVAAMALLVLITLLNVITRYLSDESFAWTEEISVFLMVLLTLAGASGIAKRDKHIRIEFLFNKRRADGSATPRRPLALLASLVSSLVFAVLAVLFARWVWDQWRFSETSMGLGIPLWWYGAVVPLLCAAAAWRAFTAFRRILLSKPGPDDAAVERAL